MMHLKTEPKPRRPPKKDLYPILGQAIRTENKNRWLCGQRTIRIEICEVLGISDSALSHKLKSGSFRIQEAIAIQEKFFPEIPLKELFSYKQRKKVK